MVIKNTHSSEAGRKHLVNEKNRWDELHVSKYTCTKWWFKSYSFLRYDEKIYYTTFLIIYERDKYILNCVAALIVLLKESDKLHKNFAKLLII